VKVDVYRTAGRSNPVTTLLGSLLGMSTIDIAATATAEAAPAGGMTCVKPFIIPDKWQENTNPPFDMSDTFDMYDNQGNALPNADVYDPRYGYSNLDKGTQVILRAGSGNNIAPSFYFSWAMPGGTGGSWYRDNIANCNTTVVDLGFVATQEPGNMQGPTRQGLQDLMDQDRNAYWDTVNNQIVSTMNPSPRVFPIPLYNPYEYEEGKHNGRNATLIVSNWLGFFLEDIQGNQAIGRICPISGTYAATSPTPATPLAYVIRLVQ
jgi:hypothetical protein